MAQSRPELAHDVLRHAHGRPLESLFAPQSIAVIGASEKPGSVGRAVLENLHAYPRSVYAVNPSHTHVFGQPAFRRVTDIGVPIDLAVIATPAETVPRIVGECAEAGVRSALILSAGFKECGAPGAALEQEVFAAARRASPPLRVIGPNCLGVMVPHAGLNATFAATSPRPGSVAFISQSGALCTAILDWSVRENVGFSAFVSIGSMLDVGWGDLISWLGDDPRTHSIVIYMESVGDARAFLSAAREVALTKPIIAIKVGRTEAAARAAASHTGSLTGRDAVIDAAFRRAGVLRVATIEELFDMAEVLAKQPRPRGPRLTIVTNAGGPGALAADLLVVSGGQLSPLSPASVAALDQVLPPHWSRCNPIDILGDADAARYARAVDLAIREPASDGVLAILTPQAMTDPTAIAEALKPLAGVSGKPLLASWMGGPSVDAGRNILNQAGVSTFSYPDTAARAFHAMWRNSENLRSLYETPTLTSSQPHDDARAAAPDLPLPSATTARVEQRLLAARNDGRTLLSEHESKQVLAAYGIPVVTTRVARSEQDAVDAAAQLGFPVALKLHSKTITHKTDVGGVRLDVRDAAGVRRAWRGIEQSVAAKAGPGHFLGVTVQPMVRHDGYELILGSSIDAQFGPVLLFGAGGQLVEILQDRALGLPPLTATLARRLMEQTRIHAALQGARGRAPVNLGLLEQILVRFSQLVAEQRWIREIDINPLIASADQILALDVRVVLHPPGLREEELPRLAIRPYPSHYVTRWKLRDGTPVTIRPLRPEDEPLLVEFHRTLSERSVYYRYFEPLQLDQRIAHERLSRICFIDYDREMALVVERKTGANGRREVLGVGRLSKTPGTDEAEFALLIGDQWQNRGLGTHLLKRLVQIGRDEKLARITATILPDNVEMLHLCRRVGFDLHAEPGDDWHAEIVL
ncbi:MAG TPA: bifunctional acetate--CoA ligase family protein/GNAT family N-acetyltransferase [Opitutaceae bacterium]